MGFTVKYNRLGAVAKRLSSNAQDAVDEAADALTRELKTTIWRDTALLRDVTKGVNPAPLHAVVQVGYYLGHGFYSGFQEFGTYKQAARPMVAPAAHRMEKQYALEMAQAIRQACGAG